MYFNIYYKTEKDFDHNEYILKDVASAYITEEINGNFLLEMEVLTSDINSQLIERGSVIKSFVPGPREPQLFRVTSVNKTFDRVNIVAEAIGIADLAANFIPDSNVVNKCRVDAINHLLDACMQPHSFTCEGLTDSNYNNLRIVRYNPIEAIFGSADNTVLNRFGGELQFDNFKILAKDQIGENNGVIIAHRKNITGLDISINDDNLVTRIIPLGNDELTLPEYYIDSPKIDNYEKVYHAVMKYDVGVTEATEDAPAVTEEEAYQKIRELVQLQYESGIDSLFFNYKINFIDLKDTEEYKNMAILETVNIGDTVNVMVEHLNIKLNGRVFKYKYDVLRNKFDEIEIGNKIQDISMTINGNNSQISIIKNQIDLEVSSLNNKLITGIKITEDKIVSSVNDLDKKLSSTITQTAGSLSSSITDVNNNLSSRIEQNAGLISSKVTAGEVESIISQSPDEVKVAFNAGSNCISLNNNGITVSHESGSYSTLSKDGITRYSNDHHRLYKYINHVAKISQVRNGAWTDVWLPGDFMHKTIGDDFTVVAWAGDIDSNVGAAKQKDAVRRLFIEIGAWYPDQCLLRVRPCLQKIGIATMTHFGWDYSTTTPGNAIGEGAIDVIVLAQM